MADWEVRLFGEPTIQCYGNPWIRPESNIAQEILLYLLSHRRTAQSREQLASLLWGDCSTDQSKKNLRQTLWRLRSSEALPVEIRQSFVLSVDKDHIQLNPALDFRVDTEVFEDAYQLLKGRQDPDEATICVVREALELYRGSFLEGYWHDWCLFDRERLQNMYLTMMDKLIEWSIIQRDIEQGLEYGERVLRLEPACERAHQQIMLLHHLAGNRTAALRQFDRCVKHLHEELGVEPAASTVLILREVRADSVDFDAPPIIHENVPQGPPALPHLLGRLKQFQNKLAELNRQVQKEIDLVEHYLPRHID
jgi:DNA-binding SARP family transcriptional activator